ncbi:MAG: DUF1054 family protein [bacterium]
MGVRFTQDDLDVFRIPGFQERMAAIKGKIRPKLVEFGEEAGPALMTQFKAEFFPHTAKHMRRKVNPPDETWVALGPQARGYKAYIFASLCVGKAGVQARVVMKDESEDRYLLGDNLLSNLNFFQKHEDSLSGLADYTKRDARYQPSRISSLTPALEEIGKRLKSLKTAVFDVGLELKPTSKTLSQDFLKAVDKLYPFYLCGLHKGVKLK